ncbi:MAG: Gfo/Idh/MocA family oxidoreductase [Chloroflexota bacterium]|nr:Gfo/Idh/MocA family oxidoreductase [Chloroflexota bacterium]
MLRIAILGVGWAGTRQVEAIRELGDEVTVVALVDNDGAFLAQQSMALAVDKTYIDYRQALADPDIDAVSICLPHNLHAAVAIKAAEAGKHILCEKPMATTVEEATRMIEAADKEGVKLYVAESAVYTSMARALRGMVASGDPIGELTFASMVAGFHAPDYGYKGRRSWLSTPEAGGSGTWLLHGIHSMAKLRYILGEVETVYVGEHKASSFTRKDLEGTMSGLLTLSSGVHVSVVQSCETRLKGQLRGYRLHGDRGSVLAWEEGYQIFPHDLSEHELPPIRTYEEQPLSSYALELKAFADYVHGVSVGPTTAQSERRSLAIVQAGYESAKSGKPINLRERFGEL